MNIKRKHIAIEDCPSLEEERIEELENDNDRLRGALTKLVEAYRTLGNQYASECSQDGTFDFPEDNVEMEARAALADGKEGGR